MQRHFVDFIPLDYPQYAKQLEDGRTNTWEPEIFFGVVSPPDEKGYCSFGNALWYNKDVARNAEDCLWPKSILRLSAPTAIIGFMCQRSTIWWKKPKPYPVGTNPPPEEEHGTLEVIGEFAST